MSWELSSCVLFIAVVPSVNRAQLLITTFILGLSIAVPVAVGWS